MKPAKLSRAVGSNQYRARPGHMLTAPKPAQPSLVAQAASGPVSGSPPMLSSKRQRRRQQTAALHECRDPQCSPLRLVQLLRESPTPQLVLSAVQHPRACGQVLQEVMDQAKAQQKGRTNPSVEYREARLLVMQHPQCPWSLLEREMLTARSPLYVAAGVRNPQWGSGALAIMEGNQFKSAFLQAIVSRVVPVEPTRQHWEAAVGSGSSTTRAVAAQAPDLPADLVQHLLENESSVIVRTAVAANPRLSERVACILAVEHRLNEYPSAAETIVTRPDCPPSALVAALTNTHPHIPPLALAHPNMPEEYRVLAQITHS